jgi:hypothetical protein
MMKSVGGESSSGEVGGPGYQIQLQTRFVNVINFKRDLVNIKIFGVT